MVSSAYAQHDVTHQDLYWLKYRAQIGLKNNWTLGASIEDRRYFKNNRQHMWLYTIDATRKLTNGWAVGVGFLRWTINVPSDPEADVEVTSGEWRPHVFAKQSQQWSDRLTFQTRILIENRIRQKMTQDATGNPQVADGYYAYIRPRFKWQLAYRITNAEAALPVSAYVSNEVMVHFGDQRLPNLYDQNRIGAGLSFEVTQKLGASLGYIHWYQQQAENTYVQRDIFNLYLTQKF
ncbi:uncharacterized protein DUF2490 [Marinoscillum furvescens DSM 4134]|uniref:Uncharacterized protein DUF2490 n=2 Tax=Marinoscillum furvescens TaxID=1026 RepID=A0A3D9L1M3_MARFU|nr:uncharacterized protein DUF2490 [Marinoscillum furvescens DSM 4134]